MSKKNKKSSTPFAAAASFSKNSAKGAAQLSSGNQHGVGNQKKWAKQ